MLTKIKASLDQLSRSERKVAEFVLADASRVLTMSIARVAQEADVSEPTVNRFCRTFSATGFPDFKLRLAQSLASGPALTTSMVSENDTMPEIFSKLTDKAICSVQDLKSSIDIPTLERAVDLFCQARQVAFFGMGASGSVARDAQHKFFRFNVPVVAYEDGLMQRMHASAMGTGDLAVVISHTGRTRAMVEAATLAREAGASVLALTRSDTPLSRVASVTLPVNVDENTDLYIPMVSRLMQLLVLDVLVTGVAQKRGSDFQPHLARIKKAIDGTRLSD
ncbi:MAG: transcriptional regulator HexR [Oceanospirillales bacterium TMED33]|nr:transcriptional regulator HexR [Gammaproteobacteria bacterium]RPG21506.1 MAG: transcriptional regulator HexR [Oceanospirillales bacterium TMED33]CAI8266690.1 MAG: HTH-type transcriptional regulator HexR [Gammaproteobacteria bacterium]